MSPLAKACVRDMRFYARRGVEALNGVDYLGFLERDLLVDATIRRVEVVGEASRRIMSDGAEIDAELPLRGLAAMRNVLIHRYDEVDLWEVFKEVSNNFPRYLLVLDRLVESEE